MIIARFAERLRRPRRAGIRQEPRSDVTRRGARPHADVGRVVTREAREAVTDHALALAPADFARLLLGVGSAGSVVAPAVRAREGPLAALADLARLLLGQAATFGHDRGAVRPLGAHRDVVCVRQRPRQWARAAIAPAGRHSLCLPPRDRDRPEALRVPPTYCRDRSKGTRSASFRCARPLRGTRSASKWLNQPPRGTSSAAQLEVRTREGHSDCLEAVSKTVSRHSKCLRTVSPTTSRHSKCLRVVWQTTYRRPDGTVAPFSSPAPSPPVAPRMTGCSAGRLRYVPTASRLLGSS